MSSATASAPAFYETMPARYRQLFRGPTVYEHAAIVGRRGAAPAHAEIWRRLPQGGAIACVVAEDRPGLLSYLGTAFIAQSIDILSAQLYTRRDPRRAEVVDFFWLRRDDAIATSVVEADLMRVADLLGGLMTGELRVDGRPLDARSLAAPDDATIIRFDDTPSTEAAILILETIERPGLFRAVSTALLSAHARILASKRSSGPGGRVVHRFSIAEKDGTTPDQYRRGVLQAEVLRVVGPGARYGLPARHFHSDPEAFEESPSPSP
jgi:UTP:GlnB (protein PII) uridylyltransferase